MFVLKHNCSFAVLDAAGAMHARNEIAHDIADGLVCRDTRHLSRLGVTLGGETPAIIESGIGDRVLFRAKLAKGALELAREIVLWNDALYERAVIRNTGDAGMEAALAYEFGADFLDLFELRGAKRKARGQAQAAEQKDGHIIFSYAGLDGARRVTDIAFSLPFSFHEGQAHFSIPLPARSEKTLYARFGKDAGRADERAFSDALEKARGFIAAQLARRPVITSSNPGFDAWVRQNAADIALLTEETEHGLYIHAGIPWYCTPFGRDGIITAWQVLWQDPELAKGTLAYLAAHQAAEKDAFRDSEPGKIMHEIRRGEMAALKEIPHTPYYGTADATPLFVSLAGAYFARTGDAEFIRGLWPAIENALEWIDACGDRDGDGYVEYLRGTEAGLSNQCWKDSQDSISHADGRLAEGALAICEVQGYVYGAKSTAAKMAAALGFADKAQRLAAQAAALKEKFNRDFWSDELGTYALALDGEKKPCLVSSSNPGHLLFSGIATQDRAQAAAERLMSPDMFSGWGIRTLGSREKRYEPVKPPHGYHNGTVWVHDAAICAAGFARYGLQDKAERVMTALFDAAGHFPLMRLPELFGGLPREEGKPPAPYPVACNPQAWASGAESMMLQAMLGMSVDGRAKTVTVRNPRLPPWLDWLVIDGLQAGESFARLEFRRGKDGVETKLAGSGGVTLKTAA